MLALFGIVGVWIYTNKLNASKPKRKTQAELFVEHIQEASKIALLDWTVIGNNAGNLAAALEKLGTDYNEHAGKLSSTSINPTQQATINKVIKNLYTELTNVLDTIASKDPGTITFANMKAGGVVDGLTSLNDGIRALANVVSDLSNFDPEYSNFNSKLQELSTKIIAGGKAPEIQIETKKTEFQEVVGFNKEQIDKLTELIDLKITDKAPKAPTGVSIPDTALKAAVGAVNVTGEVDFLNKFFEAVGTPAIGGGDTGAWGVDGVKGISGVFDLVDKLDKKVGPLNTDVTTLNTTVGTLGTKVGDLETKVGPVDVKTLNTTVGTLGTKVGDLERLVGPVDVTALKTTVDTLPDATTIKNHVDEITTVLKDIAGKIK